MNYSWLHILNRWLFVISLSNFKIFLFEQYLEMPELPEKKLNTTRTYMCNLVNIDQSDVM